ncbi:2-amino-3,7-dideoxy-D-threo-hept-6-ulosonate synthase [Amycolatopsis pithecellobii]|uniref:2-amino-4,5-dihydroxy-6-one-heptanoic acid-7-phosphate synthase n=1 Tax=Amycolatopsis pithecellobii TaxID=664692 RepID=A0A6N7YKD3_9PSEU|nr:2-amino-3,7-dideoxy-D-threo-hept-6-ulosonate synthase [Amycolatopsis pithecellobii]MTD53347.1 2-amino-4,5-dihydroxy-6-one-heptanoic acid-7-phosphate synthase [Amycolatopsis pithecellobii]
MSASSSFGREIRLRRLFRHGDQHLFVVPLDHSVTDGPITGTRELDRLVRLLDRAGVDAVVLHKGSARRLGARLFSRLSLVVHLSASTRHAPDPDRKYLVSTVEEALRMGADAVSVHVNLGSATEHTQLADLGRVGDACDHWNIPLLAMMYPRGPGMGDLVQTDVVAHAATIAADLGADLVKLPYPGSPAGLADVVRSCPIPVLVAGGPPLGAGTEVARLTEDVIAAGAAGIAMGRNVFQSADPAGLAKELSTVVHPADWEPAVASRSGHPLEVRA